MSTGAFTSLPFQYARLSPILFIAGNVYAALYCGSSLPLYLALIIIADVFLNQYVWKGMARLFYLPGRDWLLRPGKLPPPGGCGFIPDYSTGANSNGGLRIGMPSGHSESMTLISTFLALYLITSGPEDWRTRVGVPLLILNVFFVMWSRVITQCHTGMQVVIGSAIGYLLGLALWYVYRHYSSSHVALPDWVHGILWGLIPFLYLLAIIWFIV